MLFIFFYLFICFKLNVLIFVFFFLHYDSFKDMYFFSTYLLKV